MSGRARYSPSASRCAACPHRPPPIGFLAAARSRTLPPPVGFLPKRRRLRPRTPLDSSPRAAGFLAKRRPPASSPSAAGFLAKCRRLLPQAPPVGFLPKHRWLLPHSPPDSSMRATETGLSGSLETLCGQGYGAKVYRMLGVYLQASIITSGLFSVLVSLLWLYSEPLLVFLRQEPEVSRMAALFLRYSIPAQFAYGFIQCTLRFLQTQSVVMPLVVFSLLPLVFHVEITHAFVHYLGFGFAGAAMSVSVSLWLSFLMLAAYVMLSERFKHTWEGFSAEAFRHVLPGLKLAIPSAVMVCLKYWAFEVLVLLAGLMPNSHMSTSIIAMCENTEAISYMITYGFAAAISTRVSNELGAGNIDKAKKALTVTLALSLLLGVTFLLLLGLGHDLWAGLFSNSEAVISAFASMTPLLIGSVVLDSTQGVLSGVSRGCGWQHLAAWTNLVAFYIVGLPLSVLLGFKLGFHTKGLWVGQICGLLCQNAVLLFITLRTKWERLDLTANGKEDGFVC